MLEEKIKNFSAKMVLPLVATISLFSINGCGGDEKPSKYCCEAQKCGEEGNLPICDGEGDDCYCRVESCCEKKDCGSGYSCVGNDVGDCMCERQYTGSDRYLEVEK